MRITSEGIREIAEDFAKRGTTAQNAAREAITKGAEVAAQFLNASAGATFKTGTLASANKPQNMTIDSNSARVEVYPAGKSSQSGTQQAKVGFIQEYGRKYGRTVRPPTNWFSKGVSTAEGPVTAAIAAAWAATEER